MDQPLRRGYGEAAAGAGVQIRRPGPGTERVVFAFHWPTSARVGYWAARWYGLADVTRLLEWIREWSDHARVGFTKVRRSGLFRCAMPKWRCHGGSMPDQAELGLLNCRRLRARPREKRASGRCRPSHRLEPPKLSGASSISVSSVAQLQQRLVIDHCPSYSPVTSITAAGGKKG